MIFNKENKGTKELRELTGNYYANNEFEKVSGQIELASGEVATLIGQSLFEKAETAYLEGTEDKELLSLIQHVRQPIAIIATLRMYQRNDLSHEDSGRKFKMDSVNEKLPWEWQLNRDDEMHLEDYYRALDRLFRFLNGSGFKEWKETRTYKLAQLLLIKSGEMFDTYFPIEKSERMYTVLLPFIKEAQLMYVKKGYGTTGWDKLIQETCESESDVHFAACKALALYAMSMAMMRMQIQVIPKGIIRQYIRTAGAMASDPASMEDVRTLAGWMKDDADIWLDEMKKLRDGGVTERKLLPENDPKNKYMIL